SENDALLPHDGQTDSKRAELDNAGVARITDDRGQGSHSHDTERDKDEEIEETGLKDVSGEEEMEDKPSPRDTPGPFVKIDSISKDKDIVIAYTPNKSLEQLITVGMFWLFISLRSRRSIY
ncbi:unnamed protein product, partial [Strongylus vulgaris]